MGLGILPLQILPLSPVLFLLTIISNVRQISNNRPSHFVNHHCCLCRVFLEHNHLQYFKEVFLDGHLAEVK